ncbi:hypothetical protein SAMN02745165_00356 [Malonomonas rubra DSM 5091]|uniref:TIGR03016 family PEP-CTERM system-associated outer membrane protein n=1 Tax=Malonomonas rubra DSM 5091 TaxID=1122189 RepID=A0A1M6BZN6_MALRU|nr:hypothetical protein [Malonomonas rubra]SHI54245.1 hypothetical protein SAMN02745165_00356 [Malonomonas rubra DSM 5091]
MLLTGRHKFFWLLIGLAFLPLLVVAPVHAGDPFGFNSSWNYQEAGGDNQDSSTVSQNYNLTYSKDLSAAMSFSGSVRYSESSPSEGRDSSTLSPRLSFDLRNDLFNLNLNASETKSESEGSATRTNDAWGANLSSNLAEGWPGVRLYISQSTATDDEDLTDTQSDSAGVSVDYNYGPFEMLYDANYSQSTNNIELTESETLDQTGQVSYADTFWNGRVAVSASQQYKVAESTTKNPDGALVTSGRYYKIDADPDDAAASLGTGSFVGEDVFQQTDQNMTIQIDSPLNDAAPINGEFDVLKVGLYRLIGSERTTLQDSVADLLDSDAEWEIYYFNVGDSSWTEIPASNFNVTVGGDYFNGNFRTVVTLSLSSSYSADYVKVVSLSQNATYHAYVDDIVAYNSTVSLLDNVELTRDTTSIQSQFSTTVNLTDRWTVSYSLRRVENQYDTGDTLQLNQSLTSSYRLNGTVGFSLAVTDNIDEADNSADRKSRSYSLSMNALPLSTLNYSLAYTHTDNSSDDGRDTTSDSVSSTLTAAIYPDLTASWSVHWSQNKNSYEETKSSSYGTTVRMTARLSPKADLDFDLGYSESESTGGDTTTATTYGIDLGYRPSDMLLIDVSYDGEIEDNTSTLTGYTSWLWSRKLQSRFGFTYEFADEIEQTYNAQLSWMISRYLSLQSNGNYTITDDASSWNFNGSLNMVF